MNRIQTIGYQILTALNKVWNAISDPPINWRDVINDLLISGLFVILASNVHNTKWLCYGVAGFTFITAVADVFRIVLRDDEEEIESND